MKTIANISLILCLLIGTSCDKSKIVGNWKLVECTSSWGCQNIYTFGPSQKDECTEMKDSLQVQTRSYSYTCSEVK